MPDVPPGRSAEEITLLNLQKAVQAVIDLAAHVVAVEGYGMPDSQASGHDGP
ncbi:MAG TPA: hypothetical protein VH988_18595 [Thermoanaerobaculia bacterium]|jgi:uncharacterized protein YutE (UPF0331/DUF86 family)|nr:hypothetical protein [Thermoanaerobaculia bacterium]